MRDTRPPAQQHKWRQALAFGLPLALIELGVAVIVLLHAPEVHNPAELVLVAIPTYLVSYLVIPPIAGYRFTNQVGNDSTNSGRAGLRVGLVSFALVSFVQEVYLGILFYNLFTLPPEPRQYKVLGYLVLIALFIGCIIVNWTGAMLAAISGQIGGAVAEARARRAFRTSRVRPQEPHS